MKISEYIIKLQNKSKIIIDIKPYGELIHVFQGVLSLEPLDIVSLTYNDGESVVAEFISDHVKNDEIYYDFLINKNIVSFKQIEIQEQYENVGYTYSVNNAKYVLFMVNKFDIT